MDVGGGGSGGEAANFGSRNEYFWGINHLVVKCINLLMGKVVHRVPNNFFVALNLCYFIILEK